MTTMPFGYYDRFDPADNYEQHLFIAGRGLQAAELNEIQKLAASRLRGVADALFKDGDIVRDASILVDGTTGEVQCQPGAIYIRGAVRGVAPATLTIPVTGVVAVGVRLVERVVTSLIEPALLDPATGTRNYNQPGAERLEIVAEWAWDGDTGTGEFFPIYTVTEGVQDAKEAPPSLDAITQSLARYDRDSAGGTYVVSGLGVTKLADSGGNQVYSVAEGRARVFGYGVELTTSQRVILAAVPDLKAIANEPHLSTTASAQRINFNRAPGTAILEVSITAEKTVTLTHGVSTGAIDPLPDNSVLSLIEVKQGGTTYTAGSDYVLNADKVDWSPAGAEPAPGSTYTVKYQYITNVTPTAVDDDGFTVTGAVAGTLVQVTYSQKLPRFDRLCINASGQFVWLIGVAADYNAQPPAVPPDLLLLATVSQTWRDTRTVTNDGVRVVPMPQLARVESRLDYLVQLIAQQRLESNIHTREAGTKKGLFTDPFIDDSQRDAGTVQTAAVVNGMLMLPISSTVFQMAADITGPTSLSYSHSVRLSQELRSGFMKINPYMAFAVPAARVTLTPSVDRWTVLQTTWLSPETRWWFQWNWAPTWGDQTRDALINRTVEEVATLRTIPVSFKIEGFGAGENLASFTFDGLTLSVGSLTANGSGEITGTFNVPADVPSGSKLVRAVGAGGSNGDAVFTGQGTITRETWQRQTSIGARVDPLAQTFTLTENAQLSGVDLWFTTKPTTFAMVQIRETATGFPTQTIIAEKTLLPAAVNIGGAHTRFLFDAPVALLAGVEYALVALCNDADGAVSVAELGKFDATAQRWITSQPYTVGVLLSSSNASTWTAHQDKDLAFRILTANYTQTSRTVNLGNVAVTGATDLALLAFADNPSPQSGIQYRLTLPDASVVTVASEQPVSLPAAITGNVGVQAVLSGNAANSPVLYPGAQLVAGAVQATGTYVTRAIPAGASSTVKVIYEGNIPSGATVDVHYKGPDVGDTWVAVPQIGTGPADDGFTEFIRSLGSISETTVQIRITLNGTPAARPVLRDLRVIVS